MRANRQQRSTGGNDGRIVTQGFSRFSRGAGRTCRFGGRRQRARRGQGRAQAAGRTIRARVSRPVHALPEVRLRLPRPCHPTALDRRKHQGSLDAHARFLAQLLRFLRRGERGEALLPQSGKATVNGIAVVNERSCIAWDWKGCTVCVDECPQDAIALDEQGRPLVDDALCDGCGLCELICPSSSLRSYGGGRSEAKGIVVVAKERERA